VLTWLAYAEYIIPNNAPKTHITLRFVYRIKVFSKYKFNELTIKNRLVFLYFDWMIIGYTPIITTSQPHTQQLLLSEWSSQIWLGLRRQLIRCHALYLSYTSLLLLCHTNSANKKRHGLCWILHSVRWYKFPIPRITLLCWIIQNFDTAERGRRKNAINSIDQSTQLRKTI